VQLSFGANVALFVAKLFVAIASGSLVVTASAADSFLDLISGFVLSLTERAIRRADPLNKYPEGKQRMEPVGVVVFASIMGMSSLLIIMEALKSIAANIDSPPTLDVNASTYAILGSTIVVKILLYFFCQYVMGKLEVGHESASVEVIVLVFPVCLCRHTIIIF
jgi:divalent metal cation (Fe/Co/Zn/Cd) transporter